MSNEATPAERALREHDALERPEQPQKAAVFEVTTTPFDATVSGRAADAEGKDAEFSVEVAVPSLDAAVADADVADVVEDGWYESLSLHLADAADVAEVDVLLEQSIERQHHRVELTVRFEAWNADSGAADAKAIVDYVEGTYVQAVIPGYQYGEPVAGLLSRATDSQGDDGSGARRGGTPL